ncbi:ABC transporter permease [Saccharothrix obliqua]|uniref:ABC transporter permease n=1 Tax=Saccharothrix obliqua TaxID=2861747 RepID=UPI001C5D8AC3|nr:FtsX-like permease family protein [Saccharothrix obliqua]MBW4718356.1 ABC transporter permease [Saccharothrix obliqua]
MFVGWRDLRFAKGRFALMGTVIVLITLLVGLLSGLTAGLGRQNISAITGLPADHIIFGGSKTSYADSAVTREQWERWANTSGVHAEPLGITTTKASTGDKSTAVTVFGVSPDSPLAPVDPHEGVVLSSTAAEELGARTGDTVALTGTGLRVTAVTEDEFYSHTPVVWTSLETWRTQDAFATVLALNASDVDLSAVDAAAGTTTVAKDDSLSGIGSYSAENGSLQLMRGFLFAISALVIGAFFTVWTIQRSTDIAVLKALGASTSSLLRDALGQALVLLVGGTAVGTGLAVAIGLALGEAVPFVLTPMTVLVPAAVLVLLGLLGATLAVRRIVSVDPLTALGSAR